MDENAHPILFPLEEARTLITRQEESSGSGEMNPATRAAWFATRKLRPRDGKWGLVCLLSHKSLLQWIR